MASVPPPTLQISGSIAGCTHRSTDFVGVFNSSFFVLPSCGLVLEREPVEFSVPRTITDQRLIVPSHGGLGEPGFTRQRFCIIEKLLRRSGLHFLQLLFSILPEGPSLFPPINIRISVKLRWVPAVHDYRIRLRNMAPKHPEPRRQVQFF